MPVFAKFIKVWIWFIDQCALLTLKKMCTGPKIYVSSNYSLCKKRMFFSISDFYCHTDKINTSHILNKSVKETCLTSDSCLSMKSSQTPFLELWFFRWAQCRQNCIAPFSKFCTPLKSFSSWLCLEIQWKFLILTSYLGLLCSVWLLGYKTAFCL